ncbi:kinase [Subtercola sp. Z020]|uniref:PfkB family carbohydrate kinase n=1 Tax=Subtercola sp. Z020 TaxID=2080582 RepID=UPI000CE91EC4|nr:PfkB family carbohydrate kinase [Subtercola sp. Z020]PPF90013.1 kinase [Subtercola sp. Z020]
MFADRTPHGVFVGLATLDVVHRVAANPGSNQKITATSQSVAAGGPAANAAVTFAGLGGRATLVTALGDDPVADLIRTDLATYRVQVVDIDPHRRTPAPVSAVAVTESTGDRTVVSIDAVGDEVAPPSPAALAEVLQGADVVLIDGHHPRLAVASAEAAQAAGIPVVVDAGRWKPVMADLIPFTSAMICSNDFRTPSAGDSDATAAALVDAGVETVATTHGDGDVLWWTGGELGAVPVPRIRAVDTLGAGDVFHGAYAYFQCDPASSLATRLGEAARIAALRCSIAGPRAWLAELPRRSADAPPLPNFERDPR